MVKRNSFKKIIKKNLKKKKTKQNKRGGSSLLKGSRRPPLDEWGVYDWTENILRNNFVKKPEEAENASSKHGVSFANGNNQVFNINMENQNKSASKNFSVQPNESSSKHGVSFADGNNQVFNINMENQHQSARTNFSVPSDKSSVNTDADMEILKNMNNFSQVRVLRKNGSPFKKRSNYRLSGAHAQRLAVEQFEKEALGQNHALNAAENPVLKGEALVKKHLAKMRYTPRKAMGVSATRTRGTHKTKQKLNEVRSHHPNSWALVGKEADAHTSHER